MCSLIKLTARYCGERVPSPARFPQVEALLSCWICCTSCCCRRRCSLSLCVSANFTTRGEEQPWSGEELRDVRPVQKAHQVYLPMQGQSLHRDFFEFVFFFGLFLKGGSGVGLVPLRLKIVVCLLHSYQSKKRGHVPCIAKPGHIPRTMVQTVNHLSTLKSLIESTNRQTTDGQH